MRKTLLRAACAAVLACVALRAVAADNNPSPLPLWSHGAPNARADGGEPKVRITDQGDHVWSNIHQPSITPYLLKRNAKGAVPAVILIPGGGHRELWVDHEGHNVAKFLNGHGIAAFVLMYRLAREPNSTYTIDGDAYGDVARAIRTVRSHAAEWGVDPKKIGIIGFSAGGQLVGLATTRFDAGVSTGDPIDAVSSRPDFAAFIYPGGGMPAAPFGADAPPAFLLCGADDRPDVVAAVTQIFTALRALKVPAEMHVYAGVGHGFGFRTSDKGPVANWPNMFVDWLKVVGFD